MKRSHLLLFGISITMLLTSIALAQEGKEEKIKISQLPAAVTQSIKTECPNCVVDKASREVENGVTIYDLEFKHGQGEMDVAADGSVIDRETVTQEKDVPAAALAAIRNAGGKIRQIVKDEVRAELKEGNIIKLDSPKYFYEADLEKGNQVAEIAVSPEGQIVEAPKWRKKGTPEN